jgi:hypothetical protein
MISQETNNKTLSHRNSVLQKSEIRGPREALQVQLKLYNQCKT